MSGQTYFERDEEKIARVTASGGCAEPGPWGTVCTEDLMHRYSHYDAQDDSSWQNDWRENAPDEEDMMADSNFDTEDYASTAKRVKENDARRDTEHAPQTFAERLAGIVTKIELGMNCRVRMGASAEGKLFVQIQCWRMDVITKKMDWGFGGKGFPSEHSTTNEIVQMIFGLYKGYWEHEARENFQYRGRRVYGPHMDVDAIWEVSNRIDVRSLKHIEDQDDFPHEHPEIDPDEERIRQATLAAVKKGAKSDAEAVRNYREAERVVRAAAPHLQDGRGV